MLEDYNCFAKRRGKNISVTTQFSKKPIRLSSLSQGFDESGIKMQIAEQQNMHLQSNSTIIHQPQPQQQYQNLYPERNSDTQNYIPISASDFEEAISTTDEYTNHRYDYENSYKGYNNPESEDETHDEVKELYEVNKIHHEEHHKEPKNEFEALIQYPSNLKLIINIQNSLKATQSIGYKKWAEKFNLEQMSQTLIFIEKHQLSLDELENMAIRKPQTIQQIKSEIEALDGKLQHIALLQRHIGNLGKTKEIYKQYAQSNFSPLFRQSNLKAIADNEAAKKYFHDNGYGKKFGNELPTMQELKTRYAKTNAAKSKSWTKYHDTRNTDSGVTNAWENVKAVLNLQNEMQIQKKPKARNTR